MRRSQTCSAQTAEAGHRTRQVAQCKARGALRASDLGAPTRLVTSFRPILLFQRHNCEMVARGQVGRPARGLVPQEQSQTALRAFVAAKLAGRQDPAFYADELGVLVNATAAGRAG